MLEKEHCQGAFKRIFEPVLKVEPFPSGICYIISGSLKITEHAVKYSPSHIFIIEKYEGIIIGLLVLTVRLRGKIESPPKSHKSVVSCNHVPKKYFKNSINISPFFPVSSRAIYPITAI
jgi:hypothetical protein